MHGLSMAASRGALVLKELAINEDGPHYLHLVGRKSGLIAYLLSLIGIDPITTMDVIGNKIEVEEGSLSGKVKHLVPINSICNLGAGYFKPFVLIVVAVVLLVLTFVLSFAGDVPGGVTFILFVAAIACAVAYFLKKTLILFALPGSGFGPIVAFKRSVIEGVDIDEAQAKRIVALLTSLIAKKKVAS